MTRIDLRETLKQPEPSTSGFVFLVIKQYIPISVIVRANKNNEFDSLRVWIALKQLYTRQIIYNLNYADLSIKTGISHTTLRKHLKVILANGWASWSGKNLMLTGINKLKRHDYETCINVPVCKNKSEQILQLRKVILHRNIDNQKKQIKIKSQIVSNCNKAFGKISKAGMKKIHKAGSVKNFENSLQSETTLSNKSIGGLFGLSKHTGHRIQKKMREASLITTKTRLLFIKGNSSSFEANYLNADKGGYIYNRNNGQLFFRLSNAISIVA